MTIHRLIPADHNVHCKTSLHVFSDLVAQPKTSWQIFFLVTRPWQLFRLFDLFVVQVAIITLGGIYRQLQLIASTKDALLILQAYEAKAIQTAHEGGLQIGHRTLPNIDFYSKAWKNTSAGAIVSSVYFAEKI